MNNTAFYAALKWVCLAAFVAVMFWVVTQMTSKGFMIPAVVTAFAALGVLLVYATKRAVPMKYLVPGILTLLLLQIWPMLFTIGMSFTNYGDGHLGSQQEAADQIVANSVKQVPGSKRYAAAVAVKDGASVDNGDLFLILQDNDGKAYVATPEGPQDLPSSDVQKGVTGGIKSATGYQVLNLKQGNARSADLKTRAFPSKDGKGFIKMLGLSSAFEGAPTITYDENTQTLTNTETKKTYSPKDGKFVASDGESFSQGWRENVGWSNYSRIFTDQTLRDGFLGIFVWNVIFALLTVVGTFLLGMAIALLFNDPRLKGKSIYRSLLILPYAIPTFVTALLWKGMYNQDYGLINNMLHLDTDWLGDPFWAKVAILITNLWLGFPYMFLVCTGALQSIPGDVKEAAKIDGASPFRTLRSIIMPLLLVAVGPLLIASFSFNFNNFSLIYLLTEGGPFVGGDTNVGSTDLLITFAYRLAFAGSAPNFGFAAAVSVIIFILVALMTIPSFRFTKALEEIN